MKSLNHLAPFSSFQSHRTYFQRLECTFHIPPEKIIVTHMPNNSEQKATKVNSCYCNKKTKAFSTFNCSQIRLVLWDVKISLCRNSKSEICDLYRVQLPDDECSLYAVNPHLKAYIIQDFSTSCLT